MNKSRMLSAGLCFSVSIICGVVGSAGGQDSETQPAPSFSQSAHADRSVAQSSLNQVANSLAESGIDYMVGSLGEDLPEWAKRVEFSVDFQENIKPEWSILTVQPLYQAPDKEHTIFTQLSQRYYKYLGTGRHVTNVGFGYRKLFADNTILAGVNTFYDLEWERYHRRGGLGAELKWYGVDVNANLYRGLAAATGDGLDGDITERVLDGHDIELGVQVPYLPWLKVYGKQYFWDTKDAAEDIEGWSASIEAKVQQNLTIEAGYADDNFMSSREHFAKLSFSLPFGGPRPTMLSSKFVSDTAWEARDMSDYTLDKVRRENKILVERSTSGVVITRGN